MFEIAKVRVRLRRGFIVMYSMPSNALFTISAPEIFRVVDSDWRVGRREVYVVNPFFISKLVRIREKFDRFIRKHCHALSLGGKTIFLLPSKDKETDAQVLESMFNRYNKQKEQFAKLETDVKAFVFEGRLVTDLFRNIDVPRERRKFEAFLDILEEHGWSRAAVFEKIRFLDLDGRFMLFLYPLAVGGDSAWVENVVDMVSERVAKAIQEYLESTIAQIISDIRMALALGKKNVSIVSHRRSIKQIRGLLRAIEAPYATRILDEFLADLEVALSSNLDEAVRNIRQLVVKWGNIMAKSSFMKLLNEI